MHRDAIIIGGGPAGLLTSCYLKRFGVESVILERDRLGQSWRDMRDSMIMLSPADIRHDLTSLTFDKPISSVVDLKGPFATKEEFLTYLEIFSRDNALEIKEKEAASKIKYVDGVFEVQTSKGGSFKSPVVVIATGVAANPFIPDIEGASGNSIVTHSSNTRELEAFRGKKVLIVGAGNSGAELTVELSGVAKVTLVTRSHLKYYSQTGDLSHIRGLSESLLKELINFNIIDLKENCGLKHIEGGKVTFIDGAADEFDEIIFATGYMPRLPDVEGLTIEKTTDGYPVVNESCESVSARGLYFTGPLAHNNRFCSFIHCFRPMIEPMALHIAEHLGH